MKRKVSFKRDGITLVGHFFTPDNFHQNGQYKAIVVEGSFSSVKEQMPDIYAQKFAERGFVALAFDYGHYGESEGKPRQLESPAEKLSDLRAAVSYLSELPYVQAVGMVGVCTSAGNAAYLAADDKCIKAFATVAAFLPGPALFKMMYGEAGVAQRREQALAAKAKFEATGEEVVIAAYSEVDPTAVNYAPAGSFTYYLDATRGAIPEWKNETAVMSFEPFLSFDPVSQAHCISIPTMMVHSDGCAFPDQVKTFFSEVQGPKELVWGNGTHFDYYDQPAQVNFAVSNVTSFFNEHMS